MPTATPTDREVTKARSRSRQPEDHDGLVRATQAAALGVVERHSGPIRVVQWGRAGLYLHVGDESYRCPVRPWHLRNGAPYHVYVAPTARRIVAVEPAWT